VHFHGAAVAVADGVVMEPVLLIVAMALILILELAFHREEE